MKSQKKRSLMDLKSDISWKTQLLKGLWEECFGLLQRSCWKVIEDSQRTKLQKYIVKKILDMWKNQGASWSIFSILIYTYFQKTLEMWVRSKVKGFNRMLKAYNRGTKEDGTEIRWQITVLCCSVKWLEYLKIKKEKLQPIKNKMKNLPIENKKIWH